MQEPQKTGGNTSPEEEVSDSRVAHHRSAPLGLENLFAFHGKHEQGFERSAVALSNNAGRSGEAHCYATDSSQERDKPSKGFIESPESLRGISGQAACRMPEASR